MPKDEDGLEDLFVPSNDTSQNISLRVNSTLHQHSSLEKMIWSLPEIIAHLSTYFRLKPGDLLMTGTPSGVGALKIGDHVSIVCGKLPPCAFTIGEAE